MSTESLEKNVSIPEGSTMTSAEYIDFLAMSYELMRRYPLYCAPSEDAFSIELAHLIPEVPESVISLYLGINDAVCNKGLVCPFLVRHSHNNVFVFDPQVFAGNKDVPAGTVDVDNALREFEPPNDTWDRQWTYVMIDDPKRTFGSLWQEKGYIDTIPAKFEDFAMMSDPGDSKACIFIDAKAFDHPVNKDRPYLNKARQRGEQTVQEFAIPQSVDGEFEGLAPVILDKGEKLFVATMDYGPCDHGWSNLHRDNKELAVVNENSAVPLELVIGKPPVNPAYASKLVSARGSADMTTDWFYRGQRIVRKPLIQGLFGG